MLKVTARAKINFSLDILGTLADGYHRMDMLTGNIHLADELHITPHDALRLTVEGNPDISAKDNLVLRAADALREATGCTAGAAITLVKRIPHGAGMGGGSADAAGALLGLNQLWKTDVPQDALRRMAAKLGADVPFFITGGFARIGGFGEEIEPLPPLPDIPLVILQPCKPQPTSEVFTLYDTIVKVSHPDTDIAQHALLQSDFNALAKAADNVLYQAVAPHLPQIGEAIAALDACGAAYAAMTGSGSAVFGMFPDASQAETAYRILRKRWKKCWLSAATAQSITMEEV